MARIPKPDPIDLILDYELPLPPSEFAIKYANAERTNLTDAEISRLESKRQKRRAALQKLNATKLASKAKIARNGLIKQRNEAAKDREKRAFFNQPSAKNPDYEHWSRLAFWTIEEAAALTMVRAPELVNWKRLDGYDQYLRNSNFPTSPFVSNYQKLCEVIHRAQFAGQLNDEIAPPEFVAWANSKGFRIPKPLLRAMPQSNRASTVEAGSEPKISSQARKSSAIHKAVTTLWPDGVPQDKSVQSRNADIVECIKRTDRDLVPSDKTIGRYFKRIDS